MRGSYPEAKARSRLGKVSDLIKPLASEPVSPPSVMVGRWLRVDPFGLLPGSHMDHL
jgi:hypothetical protein